MALCFFLHNIHPKRQNFLFQVFPLKLRFLETEIQRRQNEKNTSVASHKQEIAAILTGDGRGTPNFVSITEHLSGHAQLTCSAQGSLCPRDDGFSSKLCGLVLYLQLQPPQRAKPHNHTWCLWSEHCCPGAGWRSSPKIPHVVPQILAQWQMWEHSLTADGLRSHCPCLYTSACMPLMVTNTPRTGCSLYFKAWPRCCSEKPVLGSGTSHLASWALSLSSFCLEDGNYVNDFYLIYVSDTLTAGGDFIYLFIVHVVQLHQQGNAASIQPRKSQVRAVHFSGRLQFKN